MKRKKREIDILEIPYLGNIIYISIIIEIILLFYVFYFDFGPPRAIFFRYPCVVIVLAILIFPANRRIWHYLTPKWLPRIRRRRKPNAGLTLIELLIVVAIVAIFSAGLAHLSGTAHMALERQEAWREGTALAEDAAAWLRARDALPEPGTHPAPEELLAGRPGLEAEYEIRPGPAANLREVEVRVTAQTDGHVREIAMGLILPAGEASAR